VLCSDDVVFTQSSLAAFLQGPPAGPSAKATATETEAAGTDEVVADEEAGQ
jgi:hypothetical protein